MAGDALPPLIVSHRKTVDEEVAKKGFREGHDFVYSFQNKSHVTADIFKSYVLNQIIPYIKQTRCQMKIEDSPVVLLIDNCPSHVNDEIKQILAMENIRMITFPPHKTNLFQPLDLFTFYVFKLEKSNTRSKYKKGLKLIFSTEI